MKEKRLTERLFLTVMLAAGCVLYACMLYQVFYPATVGDETFSLKLAEHSYLDVIHLTARDVHPPVYYLILKLVTDVGSLFSMHPVYMGKFTSALAFLLLGGVALTKVRRLFGNMCGAMFFLCVAGMPQMLNFSVAIRMYGWGMFFVTMTYLAFYEVLFSENRKKALVLFWLYGTLAAYTHYFSCMAIGALVLAWLIWLLLSGDRRCWKEWAGCVLAFCISYLPWIPIAIRQVGEVREGYWIEPITLDAIISYMQFLLNPAIYRFHVGSLLGIAAFALVAFTVGLGLLRAGWRPGKRRTKMASWTKEENYGRLFYAASGISVFFFVILIGVLASVLLRPVLVERYLFFGVGAFWLGFCMALTCVGKKELWLAAGAFTLLFAAINLNAFMKVEGQRRYEWKRVEEFLEEQVQPQDVLLANFGQVRLALSYRMPENRVCYYWRQRTEELFLQLYDNLRDTRDEEAILQYLPENGEMYFFDAVEIGEFHFQEDCQSPDILFEDMGAYLMENVPVRVYRVVRKTE